MRVTRSDIAKKAGVSTATVSYVINGSNQVGEETRLRVQKIIDEYNYRPDFIARAMSQKSTMQISLLINDLFNNFFAEIVTEFERLALGAGYCVNICTAGNNIDKYIDNFVTRRVDGVFCMVSPTKIEMQKLYSLKNYDIPVLISGNPRVDTNQVSLLEPDYEQGMEQALTYLKSYGHTSIAYLSAFSRDFESDTRLYNFNKMYEKLFSKDCKQIVAGTYPFYSTVESGFELTEKLLRTSREFSAILTTNDMMAIGCIEALQKHGFDVPKDVSVMGIDNISIGKYVSVPLTTIGFDKQQFAFDAFNMLLRAIKGGELLEKKEPLYITERKSVSLYSGRMF